MSVKTRRNPFIKILRILWIAATTVVSLLTVVGAFGGCVDPEISTLPAIIAMAFPALAIANFAVGLINLGVNRRAAIIQGVAFLLSANATWHVCPLNLRRPVVSEADSSLLFRVTSYNVFYLNDIQDIYPNQTNRTASYIINSNSDIVCVQECAFNYWAYLPFYTKEQYDSITTIYPYRFDNSERHLAMLSKYPITRIDLPQPPGSSSSGWLAAETVVAGDTILIVSIHLQSIGLNDDDKTLYQDMTKGMPDPEWKQGSRSLYHKLSYAFRMRALQAQMLRHQIDSLNYRNVIVAGDFNDIELCYAMRTIGKGMKSAYAHAGRGPIFTYNSDRLYFNIDHILYEGDMKIVGFERGNIKSSDHYPVTATFILQDKQ